MEKKLFEKKTVLWGAVAFLGIFVLILATVSFVSSRKNTLKPKDAALSQVNPSPSKLPETPSYPQVRVQEWVAAKAPPLPASSLQIYKIKTISPEEEAKVLAERLLGTSTVKKSAGIFIASAKNSQTRDMSIVVVNPELGESSYASTRGVLLKNPDAFVEQLYQDPTIKITARYKKKSKPGVTYYEAHRDWAAVGLPILNPFGLLNLPETQPLSSLNLRTNASTVTNSDIYATTDNSDGRERQDDFNTLTVGVKDENNTVASFKSNIRQLERSLIQTQPVLTYDAAVANLQSRRYSHLYTAPIGEGAPSFDKVYPENKASIQKATVSESFLAYIEDMPKTPQRSLEPHYLFRGTAMLDSGYQVHFIAAVPARAGSSNVQGAFIAQNNPASQQQGTFAITGSPQGVGHCGTALTCPPSPTPSGPGCGNGGPTCTPGQRPLATPTPGCGNGGPTCRPFPPAPTQPPGQPQPTLPPPQPFETPVVPPQPTTPPGLPTQRPTDRPANPTREPRPTTPPSGRRCPEENLENIREIRPGIKVGQKTTAPHRGDWYYIPDGNILDAETLLQIATEIGDPRDLDEIVEDLSRNRECPIRITGYSPTLFAYGLPSHKIIIEPQFSLSYMNAPLIDGAWDFRSDPDDETLRFKDGSKKVFLYYEYLPVRFSQPTQGWNTSKKNLSSLAREIGAKLHLTDRETERLEFEFNHAAASVPGDNVFVGRIPQSEVDKKLPLRISEGVSVVRVHFFVGDPRQNIQSPVLTPIQKSLPFVLELGAAPQK